MYDNLQWKILRKMCIDKGLNVEGCIGKDAYIKLLKDYDMENTQVAPLVVEVSEADLTALNIDHNKMRLDKLRADLDSLSAHVKVKTPQGNQIFERRFNDGRYRYHIDENENTIHFFGGTLGAICNNLTTKDGLLLRMAQNYLNANTVKGHDLMIENVN